MTNYAHTAVLSDGSPDKDVSRWQPLRDHLRNVAELAGRFGEPFGMRAQAEMAGMLHDLGKYSRRFQDRLRDPTIHGVNHWAAGARKAAELRAWLVDYAVDGHHTGLPSQGNLRQSLLKMADLRLAHELVSRTRVSRILKAYRDVPAADERAVALVLVKLAQLAADIPQVREVDINPLLADADGVVAVDARVVIAPSDGPLHKGPWHSRFVVRPYPKEWERDEQLPHGRHMFVRPVRPEDEALFLEFFNQVTEEDLRLPDPARLCALDRAGGAGPGRWPHARRGAVAGRCQLRKRRVRDPGALGPEGPWHRLAADADHDRVRRQHRPEAGRRPGAARERDHAGDVPAPGLPGAPGQG